MLGDGQMSRKGDVTGIRIGELKLYYAIKANLLFISFSEKLVTRAWKTCGRHPAFQEQSNTGDIRLELEHTRFEKWMKMLWGEAATNADSSAFFLFFVLLRYDKLTPKLFYLFTRQSAI